MRALLLVLVAASRTASAAPSCVDDGKPYDEAALKDRVGFLASEALDGRATGTKSDTATRKWIAERFACLGLTAAGTDGYQQPFEAEGKSTANVVGYIPGETDDIIVVGAHHDHLGDGHLGANDNASGLVTLLAIAQAVQQHGKPHRTIAFVAFGAEELGLYGSEYFAKNAPDALPLGRVVYDINLDMVGSYASKKAVYAMGTFKKLPATALLDKLLAKHAKLRVATGGRAERSDHAAFCSAKIPYVFFWTPDRKCYHERCDTSDNVDFAHMTEIAEVAGDLVESLAASKTDLAASKTAHGCGI